MTRGAELLAAAQRRVVVADGAAGTEFQKLGLEPGGCAEAWNTAHPERVLALHRRYVEAGAEILVTNSFNGSRLALARHGLEARTVELNRAAAALARRAAGAGAWVLGEIGPFGGFLAPLGEAAPETVRAAFLEQAGALLAGGADGIVIHTMYALEEVELAVAAARAAGAEVVIASMAFDGTPRGARTMMGTSPEQAAAALLRAGADGFGANCGREMEPAALVDVVRAYRAAAPAAVVQIRPNAGSPEVSEAGDVSGLGEAGATYGLEPGAFGAVLATLAAAGATILGGCCGTTPEHIGALRARLAPAARVP
jgi:5-methyltetrahydrofolate--homocysteine methyltransferase